MKFDRDSTGKSVVRRLTSALLTKGSRRFAREIAGRHRRVRGADALGFLVSQFGNRFGLANARSLAGERIYKQPGRFSRSTSFKSITELCMSFNSISQLFMSFNSSQLVQHLRIFLNHVRTGQNFSPGEHARIERVILAASTNRRETQQTATSAGLAPSSTSQHLSWAVESRPATLGRRDVLLRLASPRETTARQVESQTIGRVFTVTRLERENLERTQLRLSRSYLTTLQRKIADVLHRTFVRAAGLPDSERKLRQPAEELSRANTEREPHTLVSALKVMTERSLTKLIGQRRETSESTARRESDSSSRTPGVTTERSLIRLFRQRREKSESVRMPEQGSSARPSWAFAKRVDVRRIDEMFSMLSSPYTTLTRRSTFGTVMKQSRSLIERSLRDRRFFETKLLKQFTARYRTIEEGQKAQATSALSLVRRAGGMGVPSGSFVFAQPPRHEMSEEHVVKRVEAREIVEIVRKEVKQSLAGVASLSNFSRQDFEELSDQVYSSLVRRLTVERERLGLQ